MIHKTDDEQSIQQVSFRLKISRERYLRYYRGEIKTVTVMSRCGKRVQFPANLLTPFVSHEGIIGEFILRYLLSGKVVSLQKNTRL